MKDTPDLEVARRVLLMLRELHQMGYERLRAAPGMSPSGCHWRCAITPVTNIRQENGARMRSFQTNVAHYTSANGSEYYGWDDAANDTARQLADKFVERFSDIAELGKGSDPEYVRWYAEVLEATGPTGFIYAYADWGLPQDRILALNGVEVPMPPPGEG